MAETWRLIRSGHLSGARNMAVDEALMLSTAAGGPPTLRFYGWEPAAVSIGYFQDIEREVDEAACKSLDIDIVRRLTGGRAVLHDVEVTYSLVIPEDHPMIPPSVVESYRIISEGLVRGLRELGLDARMTMPKRSENGRALRPEEGGSAACFDAPSWYEVTVDGKKVIGSAQVRKYGVLLQHGSIPLQLNAEKLFAILRYSSERARERAKRAFMAKAGSIREALGRPVSFLEVCDHLLFGLQEELGIEFVESELTEREEAMADQLIRERYGKPEWNKQRGRRTGEIYTLKRSVAP